MPGSVLCPLPCPVALGTNTAGRTGPVGCGGDRAAVPQLREDLGVSLTLQLGSLPGLGNKILNLNGQIFKLQIFALYFGN